MLAVSYTGLNHHPQWTGPISNSAVTSLFRVSDSDMNVLQFAVVDPAFMNQITKVTTLIWLSISLPMLCRHLSA